MRELLLALAIGKIDHLSPEFAKVIKVYVIQLLFMLCVGGVFEFTHYSVGLYFEITGSLHYCLYK